MQCIARRLGAGASGLVLAASAVLIASTPAASADDTSTGIPTRTVVTSTDFNPTYGDSFTIKGQVQLVSASTDGGDPTYTPFPKQEVALQLCTAACHSDTPTWKPLATDTTSDDAKALFRFPLVAKSTEIYRVVFDASSYLGIIDPSAGAIQISTHRKVTMSLKQPRPRHFVMAGRITPKYAGRPVDLLKRTCDTCDFHTVATHRSSSRGGYRFAFGAPPSTSTYAIQARPSDGLSVSYSKLARILVR